MKLTTVSLPSLIKPTLLSIAVTLALTACGGDDDNNYQPPVSAQVDSDKDSIVDSKDNCTDVANKDQMDTDADGMGDVCDPDMDGDGVDNNTDAFPLDKNEIIDTDGDGTGNNADTDDDGDGVADSADVFPLDKNETLDTDGDGTGNNADTDDDGDGVADNTDAFPLDKNETLDTDGDGTGNNADTDDDGDGVADSADVFPLDKNETLDTDADGTGNNADTDDDGDGISDADEIAAGSDPLDDSKTPVSSLPPVLAFFPFDNGSVTPTNGTKISSIASNAIVAPVKIADRHGFANKAININSSDMIIKTNNFLFSNVMSVQRIASDSIVKSESFVGTLTPATTEYSTTLWTYQDSANTTYNRSPFSFTTTTAQQPDTFSLRINPVKWGGGLLSFYNGASSNGINSTAGAFPTGKWVQIALTYKDGVTKMYQDGVEVGSGTKTLSTNFDQIQIGGRLNNQQIYKIDDVTFYGKALSAAQVKTAYDDEKVAAKCTPPYCIVAIK